MAYWLFKSEPATWSWEQQRQAGAKGTFWNGVRNHLAKKHLMAMKKGERGFFYHSNDSRAIVGVVEVIKTYYPDHTDETGKFGMVDLKAVASLSRPISLAEIKVTMGDNHGAFRKDSLTSRRYCGVFLPQVQASPEGHFEFCRES